METSEPLSQSFIVKVWVEEHAEGNSQGVWHGHITHVFSGKRRYFKDLDEIRDFIQPFLGEMGVHIETGGRWRRWFQRLVGLR